MKKFLSQSFKAAFLALLFGGIVVFAAPFAGPGAFTPATNNAPLPINVSISDQQKTGGLNVGKGLGVGHMAVQSTGKILATSHIQSLGSFIGSGNVYAGINGFYAGSGIPLTLPAIPGVLNDSTVVADKFCLSGGQGSTAGCVSIWPTGSTPVNPLPVGINNHTLRYNGGTSKWEDSGVIQNNGTDAAVNGKLTINYSNPATQDGVYINNTDSAGTKVAVIVNKPAFQFWSNPNNDNADLWVRDVLSTRKISARSLINSSGDYVCSDQWGTLYNCTVNFPAVPVPQGYTCGLYNNQSTTQGCPNGSSLVQVSANGQTGTCRYYDPAITTASTAVPNNGSPYCYAPGSLGAAIVQFSTIPQDGGCLGERNVYRVIITNAIGSVTYNWTLNAGSVSSSTGAHISITSGTTSSSISVNVIYGDRGEPASSAVLNLSITDSAGRTITDFENIAIPGRPLSGNSGLICTQ